MADNGRFGPKITGNTKNFPPSSLALSLSKGRPSPAVPPNWPAGFSSGEISCPSPPPTRPKALRHLLALPGTDCPEWPEMAGLGRKWPGKQNISAARWPRTCRRAGRHQQCPQMASRILVRRILLSLPAPAAPERPQAHNSPYPERTARNGRKWPVLAGYGRKNKKIRRPLAPSPSKGQPKPALPPIGQQDSRQEKSFVPHRPRRARMPFRAYRVTRSALA